MITALKEKSPLPYGSRRDASTRFVKIMHSLSIGPSPVVPLKEGEACLAPTSRVGDHVGSPLLVPLYYLLCHSFHVIILSTYRKGDIKMGKFFVGLAIMSILAVIGCASITVPENINVGYGQPSKVDSERVPKTRTLEDCHTELNRAYVYIRRLEQKNLQIQEDKDELKEQNSSLKRQLKRYEEK